VLGATGCVGRHVCAALAARSHTVLAIARRPVPDIASKYRFCSMDIASIDAPQVASALVEEDVDIIVNATGSWSSNEEDLRYAHIQLVERLLAVVALMPTTPRLVHIGSVHEYGPVPAESSVQEDTATAPKTVYAKTKLIGSELVLDTCAAGDVDAVVLRVANVYGPHPAPESFLGALVEKLRTADPITGLELSIADARRDYVDVRDVAEAVVLAAKRPVTGQVINIGRGVAVSMRELVYALIDAAGLPKSAMHESALEVQSKGGNWTRVDTTHARQMLGWQSRFTLPESVGSMWRTAVAVKRYEKAGNRHERTSSATARHPE
jgi:nucleoside-diphosphate-sugar epimerase